MRLDLYEVGKRFGERQVLRDVTLSIPEFQSLAIVGPSGGGKATLLRLIARLATPETVWRVATRWVSHAREIYEGMMTIRPHLLPLATRSTLLMVLAAVFPYGSVYLLDCWQR